TYLIRKGDRVAQGLILPVMQAQFIVADELSETERGVGGFGSTGVVMR
ncbi:deoxyuridine 5'-triphosphate nucleotidohydrolase, partial [Brevibacillus laterosporus]|nr:deoxyuridine 5'-triphosphate nucleotidohydrolase [Brevibacillus laterosporus]